MKLAIVVLSLIAWSLVLEVDAAPILTLFNTGVAANSSDGSPATLTADGAPDQHYLIVGGVDGAISPFVTDQGAYPFPLWSLDTTASKWISPQATYTVNTQDSEGTYTYMTTFDLTGFDLNTVSISGSLAVDNNITAVRINGFDTGYSVSPGSFNFSPFSIPNGHYVGGINSIEFDVFNGPPDGRNPSGFRAQLSGTGSLLPFIDAGKFTLQLLPTNTSGGVPQGIGYATMTVGKGGGVMMGGRLPDGESFRASGVLEDLPGPAFVLNISLDYPSVTTKGAKGSLAGTLRFLTETGASNLNGALAWMKPNQAKGGYQAAIDTQLDVIGSLYTPPSQGGSVLPGFTTGTLQLSDISSFTLSATPKLTSANQLEITDPPGHLKVTVTPSTGVFKGSFLYPAAGGASQLTDFAGVLFPDQTTGEGFFLGPNGSGTVMLTPSP